jgi:glycerol-3-phosphate acyltransferase PlsY
VDTLVWDLALIGGYLVGSIPLAGRIGRAAGADAGRGSMAGPGRGSVASPGPADVWRLAGPGWGLLALTGDLAKGLLPVAIGIVSWSWWAGWAAGLGALLGTGWPLFGRLPGGSGLVTLAGVAIALSPVAGLGAMLMGAIALGVVRLLGSSGPAVAVATGFGAYPLLFLLDQADLVRLAGIGAMYLVIAVRAARTRY